MLTHKSLENLQIIILYLLPISLISGSFLSDLSVSIIGLIFLYLTISQRDFKYYKAAPVVIFWMWCLYLIIISCLSENPLLSFESSLFYFRFGLFALAIWYIIERNNSFKKNFFIILSIVFIIVLFDGYLEFFRGKNLLNYEYNGERIKGLFGNNFVIGVYLSKLLPIIFALFYSEFFKTKKIIFLLMILLISTDILVYLSGERTSFFVVGLVSICVILLTSKFRIIRLITFLISICVILTITVYKENIRERMISLTLEQTNLLNDDAVVFSPRHESFYITSFSIFKDNYILGVGPKMYREYCDKPEYSAGNSCSTHPHNTYMQLLSETGLIGALPVIFLFFYICFIFLKQFWFVYIKKIKAFSDYQICLMVSLFVSLWPIMPTQNFFNNWISIIYFIPVGFLLHNFSKRADNG